VAKKDSILGRIYVKVGSNENFLTATHVGRFQILFFILVTLGKGQIWHKSIHFCKKCQNFMVKKQFFSSREGVKVGNSETADVFDCFSQLYMLVDIEYLDLCGSFGLEIFYTCNQYIDDLMPKISR